VTDGDREVIDAREIKKGDRFSFYDRPIFVAADDAAVGTAEECAASLAQAVSADGKAKLVHFRDGVALAFHGADE